MCQLELDRVSFGNGGNGEQGQVRLVAWLARRASSVP